MGYDDFGKNDNGKKRRLTSAIDVLQSLFENGKSPLSSQYIRWRLADNWDKAVGEMISQNCRPDRYFRGTLYVAVKHPVWIQQLRFVSKDMMDGINHFVGTENWVTEIKYFVEGTNAKKTWPKRT